MTKSELIERMAQRCQPHLTARDVDLAVKLMFEHMTQCLADGERIEIRGFGSFTVRVHAARLGATPTPGSRCQSPRGWCRISSRAGGMRLRERVNRGIR